MNHNEEKDEGGNPHPWNQEDQEKETLTEERKREEKEIEGNSVKQLMKEEGEREDVDEEREEGKKGEDREREEGKKGEDREREEGKKGEDREREEGKKGEDRESERGKYERNENDDRKEKESSSNADDDETGEIIQRPKETGEPGPPSDDSVFASHAHPYAEIPVSPSDSSAPSTPLALSDASSIPTTLETSLSSTIPEHLLSLSESDSTEPATVYDPCLLVPVFRSLQLLVNKRSVSGTSSSQDVVTYVASIKVSIARRIFGQLNIASLLAAELVSSSWLHVIDVSGVWRHLYSEALRTDASLAALAIQEDFLPTSSSSSSTSSSTFKRAAIRLHRRRLDLRRKWNRGRFKFETRVAPGAGVTCFAVDAAGGALFLGGADGVVTRTPLIAGDDGGAFRGSTWAWLADDWERPLLALATTDDFLLTLTRRSLKAWRKERKDEEEGREPVAEREKDQMEDWVGLRASQDFAILGDQGGVVEVFSISNRSSTSSNAPTIDLRWRWHSRGQRRSPRFFVADDEFAVVDLDRHVTVCSMKTGEQLGRLVGHERKVYNVLYFRGVAVSASLDATVRVWDVRRRAALRILRVNEAFGLATETLTSHALASDFRERVVLFAEGRARHFDWRDVGVPVKGVRDGEDEEDEGRREKRRKRPRRRSFRLQRDMASASAPHVDATRAVTLDRDGTVSVYDFDAAPAGSAGAVVVCDVCF